MTPGTSGWTETSLHIFCLDGGPCSDGAVPGAALIFDASGNLYGTTNVGGIGPCHNEVDGCGVVFKLAQNLDGTWTYSQLYKFKGGKDGAYPQASLVFDTSGNLYGEAFAGGGKGCADTNGCGVVFELMPHPDGSWTQKVLHRFTGGYDGSQPYSGLVFDTLGSLYGTTTQGGAAGYGVVFQLTPSSGGGWKERVLHTFRGRPGKTPYGRLIFDPKGSLYGTTSAWGSDDAGAAFELSPSQNGRWAYKVIHLFHGKDGHTPFAGLTLDPLGNLYGTTAVGGLKSCSSWAGEGCGVVFKLTPQPDGQWRETILHKFTGGDDGFLIISGLTLDAAGNLYGAADAGAGGGVVFEITP